MAEFLSIFLMLLMAAFILLELITPTMGLLSAMALVALIGSIAMAYRVSSHYGLAIAIVDIALVPVTILVGLHYMKTSRMTVNAAVEAGSQDGLAKRHAALVGKTGVALTPLRPAGTVRIGDERYDVITEGTHVDPNSTVRVVRVEGDKIVVRLEKPSDKPAA